MPELPEVEILRRQIDKDVVGKRVKVAEVAGMKVVPRHPNKKHVAHKLEGTKITGVERHGRVLVLRLDSEDRVVVNLGGGGRLVRVATKEPISDGTQVTLTFTTGGQLRLVDASGGSEVFVTAAEGLVDEVSELAGLGLDPVDEPMSWTAFGERLLAHRGKLKSVLMDQKVVAGLGPVYSDEILHAAGLRHDRTTETLSTQELRRLYRAVVETLHEALKHGGSTLADGSFTDLHGKPGGFTASHQVYERDGKACKRCRAVVAKTKVAGQPAYACPQCQV